MKMYCITLDDNHYKKIKDLGYIPVGLGKEIKSEKFQRDNFGENISEKNPFYGEYTFHYWLWKNELDNLKEEWIGFCQYRKFWMKLGGQNKYENLNELSNNILKVIPSEFDNVQTILGRPFYVNSFRLSKFLKKNFKKMILNPSLLFNKNKRNIKFHFDMMHGEGNIERAIKFLNNNDQEDFLKYINKEVSFNPHNMFICNSKKILNNYYNSVFPWLKKCEKEFGFKLDGYGLKRIYGFLAERYMSFWFKKYTKYKELPIIFADITYLN